MARLPVKLDQSVKSNELNQLPQRQLVAFGVFVEAYLEYVDACYASIDEMHSSLVIKRKRRLGPISKIRENKEKVAGILGAELMFTVVLDHETHKLGILSWLNRRARRRQVSREVYRDLLDFIVEMTERYAVEAMNNMGARHESAAD